LYSGKLYFSSKGLVLGRGRWEVGKETQLKSGREEAQTVGHHDKAVPNNSTVSRPKASHDAGGQNEIEGQTLGAPTATHLMNTSQWGRAVGNRHDCPQPSNVESYSFQILCSDDVHANDKEEEDGEENLLPSLQLV